jgi:hypothetical protein
MPTERSDSHASQNPHQGWALVERRLVVSRYPALGSHSTLSTACAAMRSGTRNLVAG